jgi:hypothetical protein
MCFKLWSKSRHCRRFHRAVVAIGLILNQLVLVTGLPFPAAASGVVKDRGKPFPCMDRPCGCMNADQCWHSCCCFTMREKLAWAAAHGVEAPEFVREAAAKEVAETAACHHHDVCSEQGGCCACCRDHEAKAEPTEVVGNSSAGDDKLVSTPDAASNKLVQMQRTQWTSWIAALGCQGHGILEYLLASPGLPAFLPALQSNVQPPSTDDPAGYFISAPATVFYPPPVPPPRFS